MKCRQVLFYRIPILRGAIFYGQRIDGIYYLRCAILCFRTHLEHVDDCIDAVVRGVAALSG